MKEKIEFTKENLEELCKTSTSYRQVLIKSGRSASGGGSFTFLKKKIDEYKIDVNHFVYHTDNSSSLMSKEKYKLEDILIENSPVTQKVLRDYIKRYNIIKYKCEFCGNTGNWLNHKISLELDHINGINNDNRKENLRYLCPNCHAITSTYCGKNKKRT